MKRGIVFLTVLAVASILSAGCALSGAPSPTTQPSAPGVGNIEVRVTDAPKYGIASVNVTFSKVEVHKAAEGQGEDGDWTTLTITGGTFSGTWFDLVKLKEEGEVALLAEGEGVSTGNYTQIRVTVSEVYVDYIDGDEQIKVKAELPSNKLKFVRPFRVVDGGTTTIVLDFDLDKSVVFTGTTIYNENTEQDELKIIVKPVVKLGITYDVDTTPPAQVTGLIVTPDNSQLNLDWDANTALDLDHYNVYRSTTSGFTPDENNLIDPPQPISNSYQDTGLAPATYYYKVTAVDTSGNEGLASEEANGTIN